MMWYGRNRVLRQAAMLAAQPQQELRARNAAKAGRSKWMTEEQAQVAGARQAQLAVRGAMLCCAVL